MVTRRLRAVQAFRGARVGWTSGSGGISSAGKQSRSTGGPAARSGGAPRPSATSFPSAHSPGRLGTWLPAVVGRVAAPHGPAVVARVARLQAEEAAGAGRDVD